MATIKWMPPGAPSTTTNYQLGLHAGPTPDYRDPQVLSGNHDLFDELVAIVGFAKPTTNFILGFEEELTDQQQKVHGEVLVRNVLCAAIPPHRYQFRLTAHREKAPASRPSQTHRSAVHGDIANMDLVLGQRIQPFFSRNDHFLIQLWLASLNIRHGYTSPLDPDRARLRKEKDAPPETLEFKQRIDRRVKLDGRVRTGSWDARDIRGAIQSLHVTKIEAVRDSRGRRGVRCSGGWLGEQALTMSGEPYRVLNRYLTQFENQMPGSRAMAIRERCFPDGYLVRSPEQLAIIEEELTQRLVHRAQQNQRFALPAPSVAPPVFRPASASRRSFITKQLHEKENTKHSNPGAGGHVRPPRHPDGSRADASARSLLEIAAGHRASIGRIVAEQSGITGTLGRHIEAADGGLVLMAEASRAPAEYLRVHGILVDAAQQVVAGIGRYAEGQRHGLGGIDARTKGAGGTDPSVSGNEAAVPRLTISPRGVERVRRVILAKKKQAMPSVSGDTLEIIELDAPTSEVPMDGGYWT